VEDLDLDGKILKLILFKLVVEVCNGFFWFRIGTSGKLLWRR